MDYPKILISAPFSKHKDYILKDWFDFLKRLTYPGEIEFYFVDNSKDPEYYKRHLHCGYKIDHYTAPTGQGINKTIAECQNMILDHFVKSDCDWWFSLEVDVFCPFDTIQRLLAIKKKCCSGLYFIEGERGLHLCVGEINIVGNEIDTQSFISEKSFIWSDGTVKKGEQTGMGCLLMHKTIFTDTDIRFRDESNNQAKELNGSDTHAFSDALFYIDMKLAGVETWVDTSILCHHLNSDWNKILKKDK